MDGRFIQKIALEIIENNQCEFSLKDDKDRLLYVLAYNDGVLKLVDVLIERMRKPESEFSENLFANNTEEQNDNT